MRWTSNHRQHLHSCTGICTTGLGSLGGPSAGGTIESLDLVTNWGYKETEETKSSENTATHSKRKREGQQEEQTSRLSLLLLDLAQTTQTSPVTLCLDSVPQI
jgi:hypothetical protein